MSYLIRPFAYLCLILLGIWLRTSGRVDKREYQFITWIVLNVTFPAAIVNSFVGFVLEPSLLLIIGISILCSTAAPLVLFFLTPKMDDRRRAYFLTGAAGYNTGCFAMPVIQNFFGNAGAVICCMFDVGNALMMTNGSVIMTRALLGLDRKNAQKKKGLLGVLLQMLSSVPFDAYLIMLILTLLGVSVSEPVAMFVQPIGNANAFLAMLMVGLSFSIEKEQLAHLRDVLVLIGIRLGYAVLLCAVLLNLPLFTLQIRQVLCMIMFAPLSALAPVNCELCGGDSALSGVANSIYVLLGLAAMVACAFVLGVV